MLKGKMFATSDLEVVKSSAEMGYKLLYVGDPLEIPQGFNFVDAAPLTPDYRTITSIIDGNLDMAYMMYVELLNAPMAQETLAVMFGALSQGISIMIYFPHDSLQLSYPFFLLKFLMEAYGVKVGDKNTPFMYNEAFNKVILRLLYIYRIVPWQDYIMNVDELDPIVLMRLRQDLCTKFQIPETISDQDMTIRVQQIKDDIIKSANTPPELPKIKSRLFSTVEKDKISQNKKTTRPKPVPPRQTTQKKGKKK